MFKKCRMERKGRYLKAIRSGQIDAVNNTQKLHGKPTFSGSTLQAFAATFLSSTRCKKLQPYQVGAVAINTYYFSRRTVTFIRHSHPVLRNVVSNRNRQNCSASLLLWSVARENINSIYLLHKHYRLCVADACKPP